MKAVLVSSPGGPENLYLGETEKPHIDVLPRHILVRVKAAGVNRADILQRQGSYPPPPGVSNVIGLEISGVVEELGSEVKEWKVGDRVMALLSGGGYAEYVTILSTHAMRVPDNLSFEEAAALPEAFLTAYQSVFLIAGLKNNQKILVHAGASGVGTSVIQLTSLLSNVEVYVTAGSQDKIDYCKQLGAKDGANYKEQAWLTTIQQQSQGGVDVVLDCIGQSYFSDNLNVLNEEGTLILIGWLSGSTLPAGVNIGPILRKKLKIQGTTLRSRSDEYKTQLISKFSEFIKGKFETGQLKAVISQVFPWDEVAAAHKFIEDNLNTGKIILNGM